MATNKKKLLITESMSQHGWKLFRERGDIEAIEFPNMISAKDFDAMLRQHAPVHGVALGATAFGENELEASQDMKVVARIGVGGSPGLRSRRPGGTSSVWCPSSRSTTC